MIKKFFPILLLLCSNCSVGPDYQRPSIIKAPNVFTEAKIEWRKAKPNSDIDRGQWWKIYNDPILDNLEDELNNNNQSIAAAAYSYQSALALVEQERASYLPSITATPALSRQRSNGDSSAKSKITSSHSLGLNTSWELDIWGKYDLIYDIAVAKAGNNELASTKLSSQASLAQYYFELRMLDKNQESLDEIELIHKELLAYNQSRYKAGIANQSDLLKAENNYQSAKAAASSNKASRAKYQHAIAALIGKAPSSFVLSPIKDYKIENIIIPLNVPSELLERRPDIAKAEKLIQQANAQVGSAKAAFFPSLSLAASTTLSGDGMHKLLSMPNLMWSLGPEMSLALFDGGASKAQIKSARSQYESSVASYRQTILSAFAEVEEQLALLKSLEEQVILNDQNTANSKKTLAFIQNQYRSGIVDHAQILNAKLSYYSDSKTASDNLGLKRSAEIGLIKALGGGWKDE